MFTGEQIRSKRKGLKMSVEQLADLLRVKPDNLYKWEKGTKPNNAEDYLKIENWLSGKMENVPEKPESETKTPTMESLVRSIELNAQSRLEDIEVRKIEAKNMERLIALLEKNFSSGKHETIPVVDRPNNRQTAGQAFQDLEEDKAEEQAKKGKQTDGS